MSTGRLANGGGPAEPPGCGNNERREFLPGSERGRPARPGWVGRNPPATRDSSAGPRRSIPRKGPIQDQSGVTLEETRRYNRQRRPTLLAINSTHDGSSLVASRPSGRIGAISDQTGEVKLGWRQA